MGAGGQAGGQPAAARQRQAAILRARAGGRRPARGAENQGDVRRLRRRARGRNQLCLARRRVHTAGDLQSRGAREAGVHDRGAAESGRCRAPEARPAGGCQPVNDALAIDVRGLNKHFGDKHVVKDFSLQVKPGEIFGFLGPNGSGKTTSIRMLCGLLTPDSGSGTCLGYDVVRQTRAIKREVGYMTQRFSLWEDLTIRENLDFIARMYGMSDRRAAVTRALDELGLTSRQNQLSGTLSGGWKQRLALAACMMHEPRLLLLDEPTAGVDPKARRDFWQEIHALAARGISVLVSTHYMDEAERCHRLAYISYGSLLSSGTVDEVIAQSPLESWVVHGPDLAQLERQLRGLPGIAQVTPFGNTLHVAGVDAAALQIAIAPFRADAKYRWERSAATLEDVFIHLMDGAGGSR
ncbi:MAG: ABC transporter ATP-binding protein [Gammaproteobacteria bacterium]|nr:ABC transporter ATP-binding protein [Gammaproteobacteria bacterium]